MVSTLFFSGLKRKKRLLHLIKIGLGFLFLLFSSQLFAQNYQGTVGEVSIQGLVEVDQNYILSLLQTKELGVVSPNFISSDIRTIYQLGFAEDVQVAVIPIRQGVWKVAFEVKEKPRVNEVLLKGNSEVNEEAIREKINVRKFSIFNREVVAKDIKAIQDLYKEKKMPQAKIFYEVSQAPGQQKINVTYNIIEQPSIYLTEIHFQGNHYFSELELKRSMVSGQIDCFSWMTSSGVLDENRINQDLQIIYQIYANSGFIRLKIFRPRIRILEGKEISKALVDFYLVEGDQYRVGDVKVSSSSGETLLVEEKELLDLISLKTGEIFNVSKMNQDRTNLDNFYQDRGYAFNKIFVNNPVHEAEKTLDILYQINHGEKAYINRVNIQGNQNTYDYVVRRELEIKDSELYRSSKIIQSQKNLSQLGFFEMGTGVDFARKENLDHTLDYNINLKESQTGTLNLSLTYSEQNHFGIAASVAKRNLFGRGNSISLQASSSGTKIYSLSTTYTNYYFLDTRVSSSSTLGLSSNEEKDSSGDLAYSSFTHSVSQSFGFPIWLNWTWYNRLFVDDSRYSNVTSTGYDLINGQYHQSDRGFGTSVEYNSVDNPMFASSGANFSIGWDRIGIIPGGTANFNRLNLKYQYFKNLTQDRLVVFMGQFRFTKVIEISPDNPVPTTDRLTAGGITTIRGFDIGSVQGATSYADRSSSFDPSVLQTNNPDLYNYYRFRIGGDTMGILNFETLFPIAKDQSYLRGVVFYDAGNVWSEKRMYNITGATLNYGYLKKSYGAGVRIITPAGVIRLEYAIVLNPKPAENTGKLEFFIGALF